MQQADVFVFHDDIEFVRQSWQRRNQIKIPEANGGSKWLTVPVVKNQGQSINKVEINNEVKWRETHWSDIKQAYSEASIPYGGDHAEYFTNYANVVRDFYDTEWDSLVNFTKFTVRSLSEQIGVGDVEILSTSEMEITGTKTERVINILEAIDATEYVSGIGAKEYIDIDTFEHHGIDLYWHEFSHPEYAQPYGEFESHMSAIDYLFNVGPDTEAVLRNAESESLIRAT